MNRALGAILLGLLFVSCRQETQALAVGNVPVPALARTPAVTSAVGFPSLTGRVVDNADLLTAEQEATLSARSEGLERRTTDELVIVTIPSLGGQPIEQYARELGNHWGIGQHDRNNGVLIVVAPNERRVRIAVGDGLLTALPNDESARIIERDLLPAFRESRWFDGIDDASRAIADRLSSEGGR